MPTSAVRLVLAVLAAVLLAGCGSSTDDGGEGAGAVGVEEVLAEVEGLEGEARRQRLLELVEAEGGELSYYTSTPTRALNEIVGAFEDAHDLDVAVYRAGGETVARRILEEADAGFAGADVVHITGAELEQVAREGLLVPYESPLLQRLPDGAHTGAWTSSNAAYYVIGRNTDLVPEDEAPRRWEDLADPRWEGKVTLDPTGLIQFRTLWEFLGAEGRSDEEVEALLDAIAANGVFVQGHTLAFQLVAAGEFELHPGPLLSLENVAADGAPLGWQPAVAPTFAFEGGEGILAAAPHPAAAVLFFEWILGDGQAVLEETNQGPVTAEPPAGLAELVYADPGGLLEDAETWEARFERFVSGGRAYEEG